MTWKIFVKDLIHKLDRKYFILEDLYIFEKEINKIFPTNSEYKSKIRQILQILVKEGYIERIKKGFYKIKGE
jgi:predicted transcriptional regulator of viral defense system